MHRKQRWTLVGCATSIVFLGATLATAQSDEDFVPLFDGKTTQGWSNPYEWGEVWVEDGVIHLKGNPKFFLVSEKTYGDFILDVEVNVPVGGNSGIQFRSHQKKNKVWGYQAEVDTSQRKWAGGLYDEGRRGWLNPLKYKHEAQAAFKNGEWNRYRIEAIGDRIRIWVNGVLTTDYRDPMDVEGYIALQHHGEKGKTYRFRNVRIQDLGRREWVNLFDGKSLDGWHVQPGGKWEIKDGVLAGSSTVSEKSHGLLVSDARYDDFTVRLKFRAILGNSGFYFRIDETDKAAHAEGFQAEIHDGFETGGLYETYGRTWVLRPNQEELKKHYKPGEWSEMVVSAHGENTVVHINGHRTVDLRNDPGRRDGHFALQLHASQDMQVEFKDIQILGDPQR